jgi:hypothetical protein
MLQGNPIDEKEVSQFDTLITEAIMIGMSNILGTCIKQNYGNRTLH